MRRDSERLAIWFSFLLLGCKSARSALKPMECKAGFSCYLWVWGFADSYTAALKGLHHLLVQSRVKSLSSSCMAARETLDSWYKAKVPKLMCILSVVHEPIPDGGWRQLLCCCMKLLLKLGLSISVTSSHSVPWCRHPVAQTSSCW